MDGMDGIDVMDTVDIVDTVDRVDIVGRVDGARTFTDGPGAAKPQAKR